MSGRPKRLATCFRHAFGSSRWTWLIAPGSSAGVSRIQPVTPSTTTSGTEPARRATTGVRPGQQRLLLAGARLPEPLHVRAEQGPDPLLEVAPLLGLGALGRDHDPAASRARGPDGEVGRLLRVHAAEEQAVVVLVDLERVLGHRDRVRDRTRPA